MIAPVTALKSLADDTRLSLMLLIQQQGELCVCELTTALDQNQPKISRHLARLRSDGLLIDTRQGQWVFYDLAPLPPWLARTLTDIAEAQPELLAPHSARLEAMGDRPQRQAAMC
ncbi:metalloregulator ArsR/SmtB family transcription factor [Ferrimonas balearica]|uniref:metalloregulator ArsR/SmtB family transcription factor n=1 Tax=Ferrimonas balearica TaxID=44012 RepID=UPI001C99687D|nr:metalloregulator ArsR/SmtB family transcription factor [Ferrimonas balearica]MBY5992205.1 metalloregulator ArsR/SmtB family transcription factor [Ferrimonas balearica]